MLFVRQKMKKLLLREMERAGGEKTRDSPPLTGAGISRIYHWREERVG